MKKNITRMMAVVLCVILMASAFPASAQTKELALPGIRPLWDELFTFQCSMTRHSGLFSNANVATTAATDSAYSKIDLTVTIQVRGTGGWTDTSYVWTNSGTAVASVDKNVSLASGNYRTKSVAVVYSSSGQYIETITRYSGDIII